jgi:hypothetical protein
MKNTIQSIKQMLYAVLANAPEQAECTSEANAVFEDMQALRLSIELFESAGAKIYNTDQFDDSDYERIEDTKNENIIEYTDRQAAAERLDEINTILSTQPVDDDYAAQLLVERDLLDAYLSE